MSTLQTHLSTFFRSKVSTPTVLPLYGLKANALLKHNIEALLSSRHQKRADLARHCRRSRAWLTKIFQEDRREIPLKYLDRIAGFFGLEPYQLFSPGISPLTERRHRERRSGLERRVSRLAEMVQPAPSMAELQERMRQLTPEAYHRFARRMEAALTLSAPEPHGGGRPDLQETAAAPLDTTQRTRRRRRS